MTIDLEKARETNSEETRSKVAVESAPTHETQQSQRLESVGQFAADVAHDFNNILTIIQGYTSLLLSHRDLSPDIMDPLRQIATASERATNLTRQLMIFSRKNAVEPQLLDLNEVVRSFASLLRRGVGEKVVPEFNLASNPLPVHVDPGMMEQLLMNLALNARDAMAQGGTLRIETARAVVSAEEASRHQEGRGGDYVCLTLTDTGAGMTSETMAKIFDPFFTTKKTAAGLGLSAAYGIVRQHQGWIDVQSELGRGTTFKVFLPETAAKAETPPVNDAASPGGSETILVVEDEPALRFLSSRQLRKLGYRILEASSGTEALSLWRKHAHEVDLLFTDILMPDGMTGGELAETLLAEKPDLKIIYTSGYSLDVVEQEFALRKGANFLQKPYSSAAVSQLIRTLLDSRKEPAGSSR